MASGTRRRVESASILGLLADATAREDVATHLRNMNLASGDQDRVADTLPVTIDRLQDELGMVKWRL